MISNNNVKEKRIMFTSHNLGTLKIKKKLDAIPAKELTPQQKHFLANAEMDIKGMITIHDVIDAKAEQVKADAVEKEAAVNKLLAAQKATDSKAAKGKQSGKKKAE
jgi:hypothetical protein